MTDTNFKFDNGDNVKDEITGFKGIIIYRSQWLNNCNTYGVKSTKLKDGKPMVSEQFDEPQLILVEKKAYKKNQETGGPCKNIQRTNKA